MEAKQAFIGEYVNKAPRDRISLLMEHFGDFGSFRDNYRECVINLMVMMREYNIRPGDDGLGVRVQTTSGTSKITESKAMDRYEIEECFNKKKIKKKMFPDPYEHGLISTALFEYDLMEKEYRILEGFIKLMKPDERSLLIPYIKRETRVGDIASELCIEMESASKRVYRIRKALLQKVLPWFKEYKISVPA